MLRPEKNWWIGLGLLSLGAILCAGSLPSPAPAAPPAGPELALPPGQPVRKELRWGESDIYCLPLVSGQVIDLQVEQDGIDVSLILLSPGGEELLALDTPKGTGGTERLFDLAEADGIYPLRVQASPEKGRRGSYILRLEKPRPAGPRDRLRVRAYREYSRGEDLREVDTGESLRQAVVHYGEAFRLWHILGDRGEQAIVLYRRGGILRSLEDLPGAVETYERALPLSEDSGLRLSVLDLLTVSYTRLGDTQRALQTGEQALELAPAVGDPVSHAAALNNLAVLYRRLGETDKALEFVERSLEKWRDVGDHPQKAKALYNQGDILLAVGNPKPVLGIARECLRISEETGAGEEAKAHWLLGVAFDQLGSRSIALAHLERSRQKAHEAGNSQDEALALNQEGSILLVMGDLASAREAFEEARQIARRSRHPDNQAFSLSGLGHVLLKQGKAAGALQSFEQSRKLYGELGDSNAQSMVLYGIALAEREMGHIQEARAAIDEALGLVEELREGIGQSGLRSYVIGARTDLYDLRVDLLLRLHALRPGQGLDEQAFAASEWRRARSLLEQVKTMGAGIPRDVRKEDLRHQSFLRSRLLQLAQEKLKIISGAKARGERRGLSEIEREIDETIAQWEGLSEDMRRQSPAYAATTLPKLVGVQEVQELLDPDTALIAYTIGEKRSFLWWIEKDVLEVHQDLPPRAELETLAGNVYDFLSKPPQTSQRGATKTALTELGANLLGPVAGRLGRVRRLAVVADDVLQTLPFAVLPVPGTGAPLIETHAVVQLPSASLAAALRSRQKGRPIPPKIMAVFGDPVFDDSDPRFHRGRGKSDLEPGGLSRLPASEREVKAILDLVPTAKSRRFIGFDATLNSAMDRELAQYRYIHFATHGLVDPDNPNLSGIQLSQIDPQGRSLEGGGLLRFYEVYNLSFPADLVTLSACRTAYGLRTRGEDPLGMSRSFLYAGASRVLGTLWNVDDRDAADLMTLFYQALLRDGKSPSMALQVAQKTMRARERTREPYHWAGFVLQGDWR